MPAVYETSPLNIFNNQHTPIYVDTHAVSNWWGTVEPHFLRLDLTQGLDKAALTNTGLLPDTQTSGDLLGIDTAVKGIEDYLNQNQINYIVGIAGLLLISAAVFQIVKPI